LLARFRDEFNSLQRNNHNDLTMTAIPIGLHTGVDAKDIARATVALQSVVLATLATLIDAGQSLPAFAQNIGVPGWQEAFKFTPDPANAAQSKFEIQLPYNPRIWSAYRDLRKSVLPVPARPGTLAAFVATASATVPTAAHLEQYLFDRVKAYQLAGGDAKISPAIDPLTKRPYLSIIGTIPYTMDIALADPSGGGGGGNS
jgi:hypothetical protein